GPASGPRPASSSPATGAMPSRMMPRSKVKSGRTGMSKRRGESICARAMVRRCSHRDRFSASASRRQGFYVREVSVGIAGDGWPNGTLLLSAVLCGQAYRNGFDIRYPLDVSLKIEDQIQKLQ